MTFPAEVCEGMKRNRGPIFPAPAALVARPLRGLSGNEKRRRADIYDGPELQHAPIGSRIR